MTYDGLVELLKCKSVSDELLALCAIVGLHREWHFMCSHCLKIEGGFMSYPCPTIQAIEKEFK